ncbi:SpoIIE family protein phosphatase [Streptomyces olivaceoviridis]
MVVSRAGAAGVAIDHARLFTRVRSGTGRSNASCCRHCPTCIPSPSPRSTVPATAPAYLGGDWYDAVLLLDSACAAVIGDVVDHNLESAAGMAQTGHMPRALLHDRRTPRSAVLCQLDRTLQAITDTPLTTRPAPTTSMPCAGASVIFSTDGLVEHPHRPIDTGLRALYAAATAHAPCH